MHWGDFHADIDSHLSWFVQTSVSLENLEHEVPLHDDRCIHEFSSMEFVKLGANPASCSNFSIPIISAQQSAVSHFLLELPASAMFMQTSRPIVPSLNLRL
ncbi:MAG: hypothetical protein A3F68_01700 [Acidobacteria bacterium RIFCSPLOWO2_12_FULL_54_10]|nr:MAG: hypothetical protein A3F68_01700 [Acidobacteria bacterium RIFCSPLOWO2_12_FULL_54_10]